MEPETTKSRGRKPKSRGRKTKTRGLTSEDTALPEDSSPPLIEASASKRPRTASDGGYSSRHIKENKTDVHASLHDHSLHGMKTGDIDQQSDDNNPPTASTSMADSQKDDYSNGGSVSDVVTLLEVTNELSSVVTKSHQIGVQLGVSDSTLRKIEADYQYADRRFSAVISSWKRGNTPVPVTWESLVKALESSSVDEGGLAKKLRKKCGMEVTESPAETDSTIILPYMRENSSESVGDPTKGDTNPQPVLTFPLLNPKDMSEEEKQQLQEKLYVSSVEMMEKFQALFSNTIKSLKQRNVSVDEILSNTVCFGALSPIYEDVNQPPFRQQIPALTTCKSVDGAMQVIGQYCSFFNFRLIENIIKELGTDQDKENLSMYMKEFHNYGQHRVFECPSELGTISDDDTKIFVKLDSTYDKCYLNNLRLFTDKLSSILKVSPLKLCRVEPGCLKLVFQLPFAVLQGIFSLSSEQEAELSNLSVNELWLNDDYHFNRQQYQNKQKGESVSEAESVVATSDNKQKGESVSEAESVVATSDKGESVSEAESVVATSDDKQKGESVSEAESVVATSDVSSATLRQEMQSEHSKSLVHVDIGVMSSSELCPEVSGSVTSSIHSKSYSYIQHGTDSEDKNEDATVYPNSSDTPRLIVNTEKDAQLPSTSVCSDDKYTISVQETDQNVKSECVLSKLPAIKATDYVHEVHSHFGQSLLSNYLNISSDVENLETECDLDSSTDPTTNVPVTKSLVSRSSTTTPSRHSTPILSRLNTDQGFSAIESESAVVATSLSTGNRFGIVNSFKRATLCNSISNLISKTEFDIGEWKMNGSKAKFQFHAQGLDQDSVNHNGTVTATFQFPDHSKKPQEMDIMECEFKLSVNVFRGSIEESHIIGQSSSVRRLDEDDRKRRTLHMTVHNVVNLQKIIFSASSVDKISIEVMVEWTTS